jgi:beta-mannosidase
MIPDPRAGRNEDECAWIGEADWIYRLNFEADPEILRAPHVDLCFDGLDTVVQVWLAGQLIHRGDNMFTSTRVDVRELLRPHGNELIIVFTSALREGRRRLADAMAASGSDTPPPLWNGEASRLYLRKAQYHYGWDWGPVILTAGPWREIRLEAFDIRISDLSVTTRLGPAARVTVTTSVEGEVAGATVAGHVTDNAGRQVAEFTAPVIDGRAEATIDIQDPQLWWPNGHGAQPLYQVTAAVSQHGVDLDSRQARFGLRRIELRQEPVAGEPGSSFEFAVNGKAIFVGGAAWIPADNLAPAVGRERYDRLLQLAADAGMSMIRVWGGGIYEDDYFYQRCDELGLLVWQDFMFACGIYPADDDFVASVRAEAEHNLRRLRNHPCLALLCGNNEDYALAKVSGLYETPADPVIPAFPARRIYERTLPDICAQLTPDVPYWPGSPYLGRDVSDPLVGNRHNWSEDPPRPLRTADYPGPDARFISEFGMQAPADIRTLESAIGVGELHIDSPVLRHHNKSPGGHKRMLGYTDDVFGPTTDFTDHVYRTQLNQAACLSTAVRRWRRRFGSPGRHRTSGALVWQLNDCWPAVSWALVDSGLRIKPAYYAFARALAPVIVGLADDGDGPLLWAGNATDEAVRAELSVRAFAISGEQRDERQITVELPPNQSVELGPAGIAAGDDTVLQAELRSSSAVRAVDTLWPQPVKQISLSDPGLTLRPAGPDAVALIVRRPALGVLLTGPDDVRFSDNLLDLMPGPERVVAVTGLRGRELGWTSYRP